MSGTCANDLKASGQAYPRTCPRCGLGPCTRLVDAGTIGRGLAKLAQDYRQAKSAAELAREVSKQAMQRANAADDAVRDARVAFNAAVDKLLDGG